MKAELPKWNSGISLRAEAADAHCFHWVLLQMNKHVSMMYMHMFAAYFGLTVVCCLRKPLPSASEDKDQTATSPSLFTMLGEDKVMWVGSDLG